MAKAIIELQKVTRTYRLGKEPLHALNNVTFQVKEGEYVAITGASGSGKSTLVNVIGGLDTPTIGTVIVNGQDLSHMPDDQLSVYRNQSIGFVFQSFNLQITNTALENVMLPLVFCGMKQEDRKKLATEYLQAVGLSERLHHKPNELSSGQQQLVAIARALVMKPKILIADEPTGNLDSARGLEILEILRKINKQGTTLLMVTHDPNTAHLADRIVLMRDGSLSGLSG